MDTLDPVARYVAFAGLALSSISVVISGATYRRDRPHLTVTLQRDMRIIYPGQQDAVSEVYRQLAEMAAGKDGIPIPSEIALRDPNKTWAYIQVVNDGRRPLTFQKAALFVPTNRDRPFYVAAESTVRRLEEGEHIDVPIDEDQLKGVRVLCAMAQDITGRMYFSRAPWNWPGLVLRFRRLVRLPLGRRRRRP